MDEDKIKIEHHYYNELIEDNGKWRIIEREYPQFTAIERESLLNKPSGYSDDEVFAVLARSGEKLVGGQIMFTTRVKIDNQIIIAQTGTYLFSLEEYQKQNVGSFVFFDSIRLLKSQNGLFCGISQQALGLYKSTKYHIFEFPRLIYLKRSKSVVQHILRTESSLIKPIVWLANGFLKCHHALLDFLYSSDKYSVELSENIPDEVVDIVNEDPHPYSELHDRSWFEWNLYYRFRDDDRIVKKLYLVKKDGKTEAFFATKEEFFPQASSRGFKNVYLGSIMEWGISSQSSLTEDRLYILAINSFPNNIDAVQVASSDALVIDKLKKRLFVQVGCANMAIKIRDPKVSDIGDISKWRLRIGGGETFID